MRKIRLTSAGVFLRAYRFPLVFALVCALVALLPLVAPVAFLPVSPAAAQVPQVQTDPRVGYNAALIVPDRIEEVPNLTPELDKFPELDNFAWRAFVSLNWPSLTDPEHRGVPDRTKTIGDPGPRVWETFKARYELFQVGPDGNPIPAPPWGTYDAVTPCGGDSSGPNKTLATFDPFMDFNQSAISGAPASPLVAQNHTYTRYETRLNEPEYSAIAVNGWSEGKNMPNVENPVRLPAGSVAVKAAWRPLTAADTPAMRARYYVVENANIVDVAKTIAARHVVCSKSDVALVGLHIVIRTPRRPQGLWATFEQVDNVPAAGPYEPDAKTAGVPYSYFNVAKPDLGLWPQLGSAGTLPVSLDHPPKLNPEPNQVVRRKPIHLSTLAMSRYYWSLKGVKGTVWANYMLVAVQWPSHAMPVDPYNDGVFFPEARKENLANTTMETYFQDQPSSCMSCHQGFNQRGRDFLGILGSFR
ncbi:MAG TPA: hypothetical protein VI306_02750 [Pyrinomonadaceae bacterium]